MVVFLDWFNDDTAPLPSSDPVLKAGLAHLWFVTIHPFDDGTANPTNTLYGYDGLGHLTSDSRTGSNPYSRSYTVDGVGDRVALTLNGTAYGPIYYGSDDELNGNGSLIYYYYDADGQPTYTLSGGGVRTDYTFDFDGQMTGLSKPGTATTFQYDALGRQCARTVNGARTNYYYSGASMLFETNASGETAVYTWGNGLIRRNGEYPLSDGRGTERQETDGGRNVTATLATDASGMAVGSSGSSGSAYGFQGGSGYRSDGDGPAGFTAFQKVGARYYDPLFGRFITRDTELGQRPYTYCDGDPVNCVDPTGHEAYAAPVTGESMAHDGLGAAFGAASGGADSETVDGLISLSTFRPGFTNVTPTATNATSGSATVTLTKAGLIDTTTAVVTLKLGTVTIMDTLTLVQSPTLTSVANKLSTTVDIGGGWSLIGAWQTPVHGAPGSFTVGGGYKWGGAKPNP